MCLSLKPTPGVACFAWLGDVSPQIALWNIAAILGCPLSSCLLSSWFLAPNTLMLETSGFLPKHGPHAVCALPTVDDLFLTKVAVIAASIMSLGR